jgi:hypothetical protein
VRGEPGLEGGVVFVGDAGRQVQRRQKRPGRKIGERKIGERKMKYSLSSPAARAAARVV